MKENLTNKHNKQTKIASRLIKHQASTTQRFPITFFFLPFFPGMFPACFFTDWLLLFIFTCKFLWCFPRFFLFLSLLPFLSCSPHLSPTPIEANTHTPKKKPTSPHSNSQAHKQTTIGAQTHLEVILLSCRLDRCLNVPDCAIFANIHFFSSTSRLSLTDHLRPCKLQRQQIKASYSGMQTLMGRHYFCSFLYAFLLFSLLIACILHMISLRSVL